ncbi:hypothetical protein QMA12_06295 [Pseudoalteromonas sp. APC 3893]|nr:hypothetical protein [Pseudoalteromonas sp. APC 3893]
MPRFFCVWSKERVGELASWRVGELARVKLLEVKFASITANLRVINVKDPPSKEGGFELAP